MGIELGIGTLCELPLEPQLLHAAWQFERIQFEFFEHSPTDAQKLHN